MSRLTTRTLPRVRMYRQGLGDCFLVSLPGRSKNPFHMLIDCGVHAGTAHEKSLMNDVALDVEQATEGRIDVVVVSHDHWNNVSGFSQARDVFNRVEILEVWMGWTEDSGDPMAEDMRRRRDGALRGLRVMAGRLGELDSEPRTSAAARLKVPLSFFGLASASRPRGALDYLRNHPSRPRVRYLRPGGPVRELGGTIGARAYILGPPRNPSPGGPGATSSSEGALGVLSASFALFAASGGFADDEGGLVERSQAFDARYRVDPDRAKSLPFFRTRYLAPEDAWRRLGSDWMSAGEPLALALDHYTNDLSLALAIEMEPGGRVLLFPGDAQASQWLTWAGLCWPNADPAAAPVTSADLLGRTVLYKVGHHGAATATPVVGGLDALSSPTLAAMVTVNKELCDQFGWRLPCPELLKRLVRATRGRVLRSDEDFPDRPEGVTHREWDAFRESVSTDEKHLFTDYVIQDETSPLK
jgi:hypothetical protein